MNLHGVDFSGAKNGGIGGIRVAHRRVGDRSPIDSIARVHRNELKRMILDSRNDGESHLWLIDAPFGVAIPTLEACGVEPRWDAMEKWLTEAGDPRQWRRGIRAHTRKEVRREADRFARTPMAPMNLRVFKQTWSVVAEILGPLSREGIRIEPLAGPSSRVVVAEGCPASVLARIGGPLRGYKGKGTPPRQKRAEIIELLSRNGVRVTDRVRRECVEDDNGDALDSVILCAKYWQGPVPNIAYQEGWVY